MSQRAWLVPDEIEAGTVCVKLSVPADVNLFGALIGAVLLLTDSLNWEQTGDAAPEDVTAIFAEVLDSLIESVPCDV